MRILVTFAVEAEFAPWQRIARLQAVDPLKSKKFGFGSRDIYEGTVAGATVRVLITGMGWWNARRAVEMSYESFLPEVCISTGFAGSLRPEYQPGDILVAREIKEIRGSRSMPSDPELVELAIAQGARAVDRFLGSKRIIRDAQEKRRIGVSGSAVEMESFRVIAAAFGRGIPAVAVRGISDAYDVSLPYDFQKAADRNGKLRIPLLLGQIARRPKGLPGLIQLGRDSRHTAVKIANFLSEFVGAITKVRASEKSAQVAV